MPSGIPRSPTPSNASPRLFAASRAVSSATAGAVTSPGRRGSSTRPVRTCCSTHHRKLNRWLQLGGHSDGDHEQLRVACREAAEESGLAVVPVATALFDIDIHPIPARRGDPAHLHYDARFALRVVGNEGYRLSDESHALSWVRIDDLATVTIEPSMLRMAQKWRGRSIAARDRQRRRSVGRSACGAPTWCGS